MEAPSTAAPSSRHGKRYVPILSGVLGACGLLLLLGGVFCLLLRRRRQRLRITQEATSEVCMHAYAAQSSIRTGERFEMEGRDGDFFRAGGRRTLASTRLDTAHLLSEERSHEPTPSSRKGQSALAGDDFFSISYGSGPTTPGQTPLADWALNGLQSIQDSVPCTSLQQEVPLLGPEYDFPFSDIDLMPESTWDSGPDANLSDPWSESVDDFGLPRISGSDHQNLDPFNAPNSETSIEQERCAGPNPPSESPQFEGLLNSLSNPVPPNSISPKDTPPQPTQLPLPPAPTFRCPTCPRKFISKSSLESHQQRHKRFPCDIVGCGKDFTTPKDLRRHQKTVHANQCSSPSQVLKCEEPECIYSTRRKDLFKRHATIHRTGRKKREEVMTE